MSSKRRSPRCAEYPSEHCPLIYSDSRGDNPQELITIPVKSMKNSSKSSENILVCMFKNKVLSEPIRLIIPQEEYDVSVITFLDHPGLTRIFLVCLCLSFPCTHKTEYAGLSL